MIFNKHFILSASVLLCLTGCVNPAFESIRGQKADIVRTQKGEPVTILKENGFTMWTYRSNECTQIIFFDNEGQAADFQEFGTCPEEE